ncbi:hypothetical protein [Haloarchaeobius sp. HME9146]|uniref:hypothetical protein n=1 Tax=Haloarchaeobius sp. HME9146 TaxID=2978732 RepID=UPI0021C01A90|nr:hypothetical protein [Haloarchaeobius sp. HME9146]MCT9098175.1 hypothetical protein [Haloarchaeobius sp. HME9146]
MTDLQTIEARVAALETIVEEQANSIRELEADLEQAHEDRESLEERCAVLEDTVERQDALLDALRKRGAVTRRQVAELQSRELEKGAHLRYDHVEPTVEHLDVDGDRLERFTGDTGMEWVRLPDSTDPLDRSGTTTLPAADLLPIQQLAWMDEDLLASAASKRADYIAAKVWAERGKHTPGSVWSKGCRSVREYIDASDIRLHIKSELEREDESLSHDYAKKLAGRAMQRIRELAKNRVYIERRSHRKDGLKYKERRLVVPTDSEIPGETAPNTDPPGTIGVPG